MAYRNSNSIKEKILILIEPYKILPKNRSVRLPFNNFFNLPIELPISEYVHLLNLTLQNQYNQVYDKAVFKMIENIDQNCTESIELLHLYYVKEPEEKPEEYVTEIYYKIPDLTEDSGYVNVQDNDYELLNEKFGYNFLEKYRECESSFTSIYFGMRSSTLGGHQNVILIYTNRTTIYLYIYEPHGAKYEKYNDLTGNFVEYLTKLLENEIDLDHPGFNKSVIKVGKILISCPKGIQTIVRDEQGICAIVSAFWLYILLQVVNLCTEEEKEYLKTNMYLIEKTIIESYGYETLYNILIHFGYDMLSEIVSSIGSDEKDPDKKLKKIKNFIDSFKKVFEKEKIEKDTIRKYRRTKPSSLYSTLSSIFEDKRVSYTPSNLIRQQDGSDCKQNDQCESNNCDPKTNKCMSTLIRRKDGKYCQTDNQCLSDFCNKEERKCRPYKYYNPIKPEKSERFNPDALLEKDEFSKRRYLTDGAKCKSNQQCISYNCDKNEKICKPFQSEYYDKKEHGQPCRINKECISHMCDPTTKTCIDVPFRKAIIKKDENRFKPF